ncbi:MAG: hypothetical protein ACFFDS_01635 [Candidatus Thorarchaeota archaeon]
MNDWSEFFSRKIQKYWRISLVLSSLIIVIVLRFTTIFKIFLITLVFLIIIIPTILLLTSGFLKDIKFYLLRFENLPKNEFPITPKIDGIQFQLGVSHEEILEGHKSAFRYEDEDIYTKKKRD